ncbi:LOW QUALITY PROTEIN: peptidase inhibitor R3HDML [Neosynchiropus ocellatus]
MFTSQWCSGCRPQTGAAHSQLLMAALLWMRSHIVSATVLLSLAQAQAFNVTTAAHSVVAPLHSRTKRALSSRETSVLLDYHNRVRSQVFPPAANMEYMRSFSHQRYHGAPGRTQPYDGNVGKRILTYLLISHFSYPDRCSGSVCSHDTQMVWASTRKVGCSKECTNMVVFGSTWREATPLVCNYSIKGNWVGEAPYKAGRPCSVCPSTYGSSCWRNRCTPNSKMKRLNR